MSLTMAKPCLDGSRGVPEEQLKLAGEPLCWYAAHTQPRHEKNVERHLRMREIETYLPLHREVRLWNQRRAEVTIPLFPGYVFVRLYLKDRLKALEHPSVVSFVSFSGRPATLPDTEIQALRNTLAQREAEPYPYLTPGKRVRIRSGPLAGLEGTIVRKKGRLRMIVSVDFLQRSIAVDMEPTDLRLTA